MSSIYILYTFVTSKMVNICLKIYSLNMTLCIQLYTIHQCPLVEHNLPCMNTSKNGCLFVLTVLPAVAMKINT